MPELLLIRHAKSDWDASYSDDRERPLNERGRRSAESVGRLLRATRRMPDRAVTSPAVRARTTIETANSAGSWNVPIEMDDRLYGGGVDAALAVVRERNDGAERLIVAGHEPTWSSLVSAVIGGGSVRMATGTVVALEVPPWSQLAWGTGRLLWMINPRLLTDGNLDLRS